MKSLILSVLVVSGLTGAILIGTRRDEGTAGFAALDQESMEVLVSRLDRIEERVDRLGELEDRVDRLASRTAPSNARAAIRSGESNAAGEREDPKRQSPATTEAGDDLRSYIVRVMDEVREEKLAEQRRRAEERRREIAELREGPYGNYNYRVNTMAKRLDLSDRQKQHYYLNLMDYNRMIDQSRERESQDQENRQQYRDERRRIRGEFSQVILASLTPEQAEVFSSMPSQEQRPDGSAGYVTTSLQLSPGAVPPDGNSFIQVITQEGADGEVLLETTRGLPAAPVEPTAVREALESAEQAIAVERATADEAQRAAQLEAARKAAEKAASDK